MRCKQRGAVKGTEGWKETMESAYEANVLIATRPPGASTCAVPQRKCNWRRNVNAEKNVWEVHANTKESEWV